MIRRSTVKAGIAAAAAPPGGAETPPARLSRWRSSGARTTGFTIATSVMPGRPEKRLASETDTRTLSAAKPVVALLPPASRRLIRPNVTVGDGRNANVVSPSMRSRYPVRLSI